MLNMCLEKPDVYQNNHPTFPMITSKKNQTLMRDKRMRSDDQNSKQHFVVLFVLNLYKYGDVRKVNNKVSASNTET